MSKIILITLVLTQIYDVAFSQNVETYTGDKRFGIDLLWFKNFKNEKQEKTPFLFISRNRVSTDYVNSPTLFSSTNAISYNLKSGVGIIGVAYFSSTDLIPKLGIQYAKTKSNFMFLGWLVADLKNEGGVELFTVFRFQPSINDKLHVFSQVELYPVYNLSSRNINFTQRIRLGLKHNSWIIGPMVDFNQTQKNGLIQTNNIGGFLRHEF